jgi:hypothetical protein
MPVPVGHDGIKISRQAGGSLNADRSSRVHDAYQVGANDLWLNGATTFNQTLHILLVKELASPPLAECRQPCARPRSYACLLA